LGIGCGAGPDGDLGVAGAWLPDGLLGGEGGGGEEEIEGEGGGLHVGSEDLGIASSWERGQLLFGVGRVAWC